MKKDPAAENQLFPEERAMKTKFARTAGLAIAFVLIALGTGWALHAADDPHRTVYACTACHQATPVAGDTLATAPLILPVPDLCMSCHGDFHAP
jgi:hypothetical protein